VDGKPKTNKDGFIEYKADRAASLDGSPPRPLPNVGHTTSTAIIAYTHLRTIPNVTKYDGTMCASMMNGEDDQCEWWGSLPAQHQDVLSYARSFVRSYQVTSVSASKNPGMAGIVFGLLYDEVQQVCGTLNIGAPDKDAVIMYATEMLCDMATTDPAEMPVAPVQWLFECGMEKLPSGKPNPNFDPAWIEAFTNIILRRIEQDGVGASDDSVF
jgi:hypothetical protein